MTNVSSKRCIFESHFIVTNNFVHKSGFEMCTIFNKKLQSYSTALFLYESTLTSLYICFLPSPKTLCVEFRTTIMDFHLHHSIQILTCCTASPSSVTLEEPCYTQPAHSQLESIQVASSPLKAEHAHYLEYALAPGTSSCIIYCCLGLGISMIV